ncbi:MAG: hypothetical protein KGI55_11160, partial [Gammaproteobacteria bacterium]|nr:hypothetical protein [Gammaproteobacteria bacterium]
MRFTLDQQSGVHVIRGYADGEFHIDEQRIRDGVIVSATELLVEPALRALADLSDAHFERILALDPEVVLLGTGAVQRFPEAPWSARLWSRGIGFEVMDSGAACRTFNV